MKLAVMYGKDTSGKVPMGGYHYMLMPVKLENEQQAQIYEMMGHIIIEVPDNKGEQLIKAACAAISHQLEVAVFADAAEKLDAD
jgi:hypothetical protein